MDDNFRLMCAPLQGLTDAAFRRFHASLAGMGVEYFTPFLRVEHGDVRRRDLSELTVSLRDEVRLTPQVIFRSDDEFRLLVDAVLSAGYDRVDMNLGCPFPPQVKRGRGAGMLTRPNVLAEVAESVKSYSGKVSFSVKMRLGVDRVDEWQSVADVLNGMPLEHVTVHPRTASQQYAGELHCDEFESLARGLRHPVIFNGDVRSPGDIAWLREHFPFIAGVMVGRGLLSRPTLFAEYRNGQEFDQDSRRKMSLELHRQLIDEYADTLCGDTQVLSHLVPWHEYLADYIDRKSLKLMRKAKTIAAYRQAFDRAR